LLLLIKPVLCRIWVHEVIATTLKKISVLFMFSYIRAIRLCFFSTSFFSLFLTHSVCKARGRSCFEASFYFLKFLRLVKQASRESVCLWLSIYLEEDFLKHLLSFGFFCLIVGTFLFQFTISLNLERQRNSSYIGNLCQNKNK